MSSHSKISPVAILAAIVSTSALAADLTNNPFLVPSVAAPPYSASTTGPFVPLNQSDSEFIGRQLRHMFEYP